MTTVRIISLGMLAPLLALTAPAQIVLLNGTSSAGKSSLAEVMVQEGNAAYEVVSFDDFHRWYREKHGISRWGPGQYQEFLVALYQHARARADAGKNVIIDTVEFDRSPERYCGILDCTNVVKAVVYCPLPDLLRRIERRNNSGDPSNRRSVLLAYQQFLEMYKLQSSSGELVVDRTNTKLIRTALAEAGAKANNPRQYQALYRGFVEAFGLDQDREIVIVPKGRYDLVINTRAKTKKQNVRILETHLRSRRNPGN